MTQIVNFFVNPDLTETLFSGRTVRARVDQIGSSFPVPIKRSRIRKKLQLCCKVDFAEIKTFPLPPNQKKSLAQAPGSFLLSFLKVISPNGWIKGLPGQKHEIFHNQLIKSVISLLPTGKLINMTSVAEPVHF